MPPLSHDDDNAAFVADVESKREAAGSRSHTSNKWLRNEWIGEANNHSNDRVAGHGGKREEEERRKWDGGRGACHLPLE